MTRPTLLTPAEVHLLRMKLAPSITHRDMVELCDSHEALRAQLATLKAENEQLKDDLAHNAITIKVATTLIRTETR